VDGLVEGTNSMIRKGGKVMQAYEFYAKPENGVIRIPDEYKNKIIDEVQIIVLEKKAWKFNRDYANARRKSDLLLPPTLKTKGWKYKREEFDERG
jgi:hypothetical protein